MSAPPGPEIGSETTTVTRVGAERGATLTLISRAPLRRAVARAIRAAISALTPRGVRAALRPAGARRPAAQRLGVQQTRVRRPAPRGRPLADAHPPPQGPPRASRAPRRRRRSPRAIRRAGRAPAQPRRAAQPPSWIHGGASSPRLRTRQRAQPAWRRPADRSQCPARRGTGYRARGDTDLEQVLRARALRAARRAARPPRPRRSRPAARLPTRRAARSATAPRAGGAGRGAPGDRHSSVPSVPREHEPPACERAQPLALEPARQPPG